MKGYSPLEKAVAYIEAHLDEDIGLRDVSQAAGYSYYHMTRLFSSVLGEPVGRYIGRRRLYKASESLVHTRRRIIDIALDSGFGSPEAFSRAFKSRFGVSPADYRKAGVDLVVNAKRGLAPEDVDHIAHNVSHRPQILILERREVAGIRGVTSLSENRFPDLWEQFLGLSPESWAAADIRYCVCETQDTAYTEAGDVTFSVMLGSPVEDLSHLPQTLVRKTLSGGRYALFTHRGALSGLQKTYQYIYGTWLPSAAAELDDREDFEAYERRVISPESPDNEVKIYIPIK